METIESAAFLFPDGTTFSLPRPARHHTLFLELKRLREAGLSERRPPHREIQGFLTSAGRFVDRTEGLAIAQAAGQIIKKHGCAPILFSEDMW